eukprot:834283-Rhodomonas_salina.1
MAGVSEDFGRGDEKSEVALDEGQRRRDETKEVVHLREGVTLSTTSHHDAAAMRCGFLTPSRNAESWTRKQSRSRPAVALLSLLRNRGSTIEHYLSFQMFKGMSGNVAKSSFTNEHGRRSLILDKLP